MKTLARRAMTIRELIIVVICLIIFAAVLMTIDGPRSGRRARATQLKEQAQATHLHKSFLTYASEFRGMLPTPGMVDRSPVEDLGELPGRGAQDITKNTTANLFSMCIMANYFTPGVCVGPTEPSSRVIELDDDSYNYQAYEPANNVWWDTNFKADLHVLSHVSYAHMMLAGERKTKFWRDTMDTVQPILGNRGPLGGVHNPNSITNKIHTPYEKWSGVIVFGDGHSEFTTAFPTSPRNGGGYQIAPECLPAGKSPPKTDAAITFTKQITEQGPIVQHD